MVTRVTKHYVTYLHEARSLGVKFGSLQELEEQLGESLPKPCTWESTTRTPLSDNEAFGVGY